MTMQKEMGKGNFTEIMFEGLSMNKWMYRYT